MGKSVTVKPGYSHVEGPSPKGPRVYQSGATIVYTDAEYAALPASITRTLNAPTTVADPARPAVDTASQAVNTITPSTGAVTAALGPNQLTLTGNITLSFPAASKLATGNVSSVELLLTQDGTGSRTLTLPGAAKAAGGSAPVLSTGAGKTDYLAYKTYDGGTTWLLVNKQLDIR